MAGFCSHQVPAAHRSLCERLAFGTLRRRRIRCGENRQRYRSRHHETRGFRRALRQSFEGRGQAFEALRKAPVRRYHRPNFAGHFPDLSHQARDERLAGAAARDTRDRLWDASGGFQPLRYCHDLDFLMFAFEFGSVILDLDEEHIVYRVHQRNTIKEDLSRVRIEIAAVIAEALSASGPRLLSPAFDERDVQAFTDVLRNKQLSDMLCFFQTVRPAFATRTAFYDYATGDKPSAAFRRIVSPA